MITFIIFFAVLGIVLVVLETILPGVICGVMGGLLMLTAVVMTFISFGLWPAFGLFMGLLIITMVVVFAAFKFLPQTAMGKKIILTGNLSDAKTSSDFQSLSHAEGRSLTMLRPAGKAEFNGKQCDVVAETGFIQAGEKIKVVLVEGARIVVRAL